MVWYACMYVYIYIYIYVCVCMYVCMYIYIYIDIDIDIDRYTGGFLKWGIAKTIGFKTKIV